MCNSSPNQAAIAYSTLPFEIDVGHHPVLNLKLLSKCQKPIIPIYQRTYLLYVIIYPLFQTKKSYKKSRARMLCFLFIIPFGHVFKRKVPRVFLVKYVYLCTIFYQ